MKVGKIKQRSKIKLVLIMNYTCPKDSLILNIITNSFQTHCGLFMILELILQQMQEAVIKIASNYGYSQNVKH